LTVFNICYKFLKKYLIVIRNELYILIFKSCNCILFFIKEQKNKGGIFDMQRVVNKLFKWDMYEWNYKKKTIIMFMWFDISNNIWYYTLDIWNISYVYI